MNSVLNATKLVKLSLLSLALTPLVVTHSTLFPYVFGKAMLIRLVMAIASIFLLMGVFWGEDILSRSRLKKINNPLTMVLIIFSVLALFSTFFADNPYRAFWGDIERSEGFLISFYMLFFFLGTSLFFEKKDWLSFFKLNLVVGIVAMGDVLMDRFAYGDIRPDGSFFGNPTFVATYALFVLYFALMVGVLDKNKTWPFLSRTVVALSLLAIFVTETRGVILGLIVALFIVLLRISLIKGGVEKFNLLGKSVEVKNLVIGTLLVILIFGGAFVVTRDNAFWQNIPGLDRLARISSTDATTQTRLINLSISMNAVNPQNVGWTRTLLGWGQEEYINAHNQFYDPAIQKYESAWFDRAHNKILDVLVMNGLLGLLGYLLIWCLIFWKTLGKDVARSNHLDSREKFWTLLFTGGIAVAYFVQNLFLFDQIAMYIPLFSIFAFVGYTFYAHEEKDTQILEKSTPRFLYAMGAFSLSIVFVTAFVWLCVIPYYQMRVAVNTFNKGHFDPGQIKTITTPNNFIQSELRIFILSGFPTRFSKDEFIQAFPQMIPLGEEALGVVVNKARTHQAMGLIYKSASRANQNTDYLVAGEDHLRKAVELASNRQDVRVSLADNLVSQGKFEEAGGVINAAVALEPEGKGMDIDSLAIFAPYDFDGSRGTLEMLKNIYASGQKPVTPEDIQQIREGYSNYFNYMYNTQDASSFEMVLKQAIKIEKTFREIIDSQMGSGLISEPIDTMEEVLTGGLNGFKARGWSAVAAN